MIQNYMVQFGKNRWRLVRADTEYDAMQIVAGFFKQPVYRAIPVQVQEQGIRILLKYHADFEQLVLCASPPSKEYRHSAREGLTSQGKESHDRGPIALLVNAVEEVARFG